MRISDVLSGNSTTKPAKKTRRLLLIAVLITGFISSVVIFVTFYGEYTGTFTLRMQKEALEKGIQLSETVGFEFPRSTLIIQPLEEIGDMLESDIDVEAARNQDGQYFDQRIPYYIAYTFYLKNTGNELVNVNYRLRIVDSYKGVENAVKIRYIQEDLISGQFIDKTFIKLANNPLLINDDIFGFIEGATKKITIFMWFDGELTDRSMMGGGIKLDMSYTISTAIGS